MKLVDQLNTRGHFTPVQMKIQRLTGPGGATTDGYVIDKFLEYKFSSNILIPVDAFSCSFFIPDRIGNRPIKKISDVIGEGDIVTLQNAETGAAIATGLVSPLELSTDPNGEVTHVQGRDLMSQFEDNAAVSITQAPLYPGAIDINSVILELVNGTRIKTRPILQNFPGGNFLFATEAGESKLSALYRYLEPLNCLAWMSPEGRITVGKPSFDAAPSGDLFVNRAQRKSNCAMRVVRNAAGIPNGITAVWAGCENAQQAFRRSVIVTKAPDAKRLRDRGHVLNQCIVVGLPNVETPEGLSDINRFGGESGYVNSYATRALARANFDELQVFCTVPGHYDERGHAFAPDTTWHVTNDRADVDEVMYLYGVDYLLGEQSGLQTQLSLCRINTIVAGGPTP